LSDRPCGLTRDTRPADLVFDPTSACRGSRRARSGMCATTPLLPVGLRSGRSAGQDLPL